VVELEHPLFATKAAVVGGDFYTGRGASLLWLPCCIAGAPYPLQPTDLFFHFLFVYTVVLCFPFYLFYVIGCFHHAMNALLLS
jgi:hypothetical protein